MTEADDARRAAVRAYQAQYRARGGDAFKRRKRRQDRARHIALSQLMANHPEEYARLRLEALKKLA